MYQPFFSVLALVVLTSTSACRSDPPLTRIFGGVGEEDRATRNGREEWRTLQMGANELMVVQHCDDVEAEISVRVEHQYVITVLEAVDETTRAQNFSCRYTVGEGSSLATLSFDGQDLEFPDVTATADGEVNGVFGPRILPDTEKDGYYEWWITPTYIDSRAVCENGVKVSAEISIELEHYLVVDEGASSSVGDCEARMESGTFRYYLEDDELFFDRAVGDGRFRFTRILEF